MLSKQPDRFEILLKASENLLGKVHDHENRLVTLENRMICDSASQLNIRLRAERHVSKILGDKKHPEYRSTIRKLWRDYWQAFQVTTYRDTPAVMYDQAISYIDHWRPRPELVENDPPPAA